MNIRLIFVSIQAGPSNATNVVNINKGDDLDSDGDSKKVQSKRRKIDGGNGVPKQSDSTSTDVGAVRAVDNGGSANLNGDDKMVRFCCCFFYTQLLFNLFKHCLSFYFIYVYI